jgi:diguanylate cyclase (GGDEF)-like protein
MQNEANKHVQSEEIEGKIYNIKHQGSIQNDFLLTIEKEFGLEVYSEIIYQLTRLQFPPIIAQQYLMNVIDHMQALSKSLGRQIGLCIASYDYFVNISKLIKNPVLIEEGQLKQKEEYADKDALTGLFNRTYFNQEITREIEKFRRFGTPFSLLMADIDHFKRINDTHGHLAGDEVLRIVAGVFSQVARAYDSVVRYGGEEFAVILPQTARKEAAIMAERSRAAIERQPLGFEGTDLGNVTISIGIATYPIDSLDKLGLVRRADQALYVAKRRRNTVVAYCDYNRRSPGFPQQISPSAGF